MRLADTLTLQARLGSVGIKVRHGGVVSKPMKEGHGHTQTPSEHQHITKVKVDKRPPHHHPMARGKFGGMSKTKMFGMDADASPSDLASHHLWMEPSATDTTIRQWRNKRHLEKKMGRNMDPFEADAELEMFGNAEVTGPCGCTLKVGEKVLVEGRGRGVIRARSNRILTVTMREGQIQVDQKFVHRPR